MSTYLSTLRLFIMIMTWIDKPRTAKFGEKTINPIIRFMSRTDLKAWERSKIPTQTKNQNRFFNRIFLLNISFYATYCRFLYLKPVSFHDFDSMLLQEINITLFFHAASYNFFFIHLFFDVYNHKIYSRLFSSSVQ